MVRATTESVAAQGEPLLGDQYTALTLAPKRVRVQSCYSLSRLERVPSFCRRDAILDGYRPPSTFQRALASVFMFHNESINIWSHLIGELLPMCDKL